MSTSPPNSVRDQVSSEEWEARVALAAAYRLVSHFKWDDLVFTHITAKVPGPEHHFLINPYGWLFDEITASSLVKIDLSGQLVSPSPHFINPAGFLIHSAIHAARADVTCVLHIHSLAGVAVSVQKEGLSALSQFSIFPLSSLAYHDYEGVALNDEERPRLVHDLGEKSFLILRNHGLLTVGANVAEAFLNMYFLEAACRVQVMAQGGGANLVQIPEKIVNQARQQAAQVSLGRGAGLVWPGLLRKLDRLDPSYKT